MKSPASFYAVSAASAAALLLGGASASPAFAQTPPPVSPAPATALPPAALDVPDDYKINVEDTISIEVSRHGDVSRVVRIPSDGRVRLLRLEAPLLAQGKTCAQISDELFKRLQTEGKLRLKPGQVSVSVVGMRPRRVFIRGNALPNRQIDLKNNWRITELVTEIGGVPQPDRLIMVRLENADKKLRPEPINIDLVQALMHPDSPQNVPLLEGDTLLLQVPQSKRLVIEGEGPRGTKDTDARFMLRDALIGMAYSPIGATGDLRHAKLWQYTVPGDPTSPVKMRQVDLYTLLTDKDSPDIPFNDLDRLEIPISQRFVYIQGAFGGPQKWYMPEDRKTYLADVMALGNTYGNAAIGEVKVRHYSADGKTLLDEKKYDFGKYKSKGDQKQNPEILPGDMVFVPSVHRTDPNVVTGSIFTGFSLYSIMKTFIPGIR